MRVSRFIISVCLLMCLGCYGCGGCTIVQPGHVGIKVNNLGSERGVQGYTIATGLTFYVPFITNIFNYPTFVQTAVWTQDAHEGVARNEEISFNTKEGTAIFGDISLSYQLVPDKVPSFYVKFRSDDLELFTHGYLRNVARDAFTEIGGQYALEDVYGAKKEELLQKVKARVNHEVNGYGVEIVQFGFTSGVRMDSKIKEALNYKLTTTQNAIAAENRLREAQANAANRVAAAEGEAKANMVLAQSITPQLIEWRQLDINEKALNRWNGSVPMVQGSGNNGLLLQLPMNNPINNKQK